MTRSVNVADDGDGDGIHQRKTTHGSCEMKTIEVQLEKKKTVIVHTYISTKYCRHDTLTRKTIIGYVQ